MTKNSIQKNPVLMVAPNGARRTRADHDALPQTIGEVVATAYACFAAGADMLHAHVRDSEGRHLLDAGLYGELLAEMARTVPNMPVQITSEAAGRYTPPEQRKLLDVKKVRAISAALREITADEDVAAQRHFYHQAQAQKTDLQHILYHPDEVMRLAAFIAEGIVPADEISVLFVLGQYAPARPGTPEDLKGFLAALEQSGLQNVRFMVCAFGQGETTCLVEAARMGGDCRVGFENNLHHPDGVLAADNAARVAEVRGALAARKLRPLT